MTDQELCDLLNRGHSKPIYRTVQQAKKEVQMDRINSVVTYILGFLGTILVFIANECLNQATELNQFIATGMLMLLGIGCVAYAVLVLSYKKEA